MNFDDLLNEIMWLYQWMETLDTFEIVYRTNLAKRMLHGVYTWTIHIKEEKEVVEWIEKIVGKNFVQKLKCIFEEVEESKTI